MEETGDKCTNTTIDRSFADDSNDKHEELQYLDLIRKIIENGNRKDDRTRVGTLSIFGTQSRYTLRNGVIPVLTTRRIFWKAVVEELLWFVRGDTNAVHLREKGVGIWDGNSSRQYLDSLGFTDREEGDLGPVYGFQWRHFGARYGNMRDDYEGEGIDQLGKVLDLIKNNPSDRRILFSAWNPVDLPKMALPPCHILCQFYVANGELSSQMYQRSADVGLGVPFNIASYSLLTHLLAHLSGLKAGEFIHTCGDTHIYANHVDILKEQIKRKPRPFPTVKIKSNKTHFEDFLAEDFELIGYNPHPAFKMRMAI